MGDYQEVNFDADEPLGIADLSALSQNQEFLYDKLFVNAPRGIVLWHQETGNITLSYSSSLSDVVTGFEFDWIPEANRLYLVQFFAPSVVVNAGAGNQRVKFTIWINTTKVGSISTNYMTPASRNQGWLVEGLINSPTAESCTITVQHQLIGATGAPTVYVEGAADSPIQMWIEDIGSASGYIDDVSLEITATSPQAIAQQAALEAARG